MNVNDTWAYIDEDGQERGWFDSAGKAQLDRNPATNPHTWRKVPPEEVNQFNQWLARIAYEQS